jgi:hypothetical protein
LTRDILALLGGGHYGLNTGKKQTDYANNFMINFACKIKNKKGARLIQHRTPFQGDEPTKETRNQKERPMETQVTGNAIAQARSEKEQQQTLHLLCSKTAQAKTS